MPTSAISSSRSASTNGNHDRLDGQADLQLYLLGDNCVKSVYFALGIQRGTPGFLKRMNLQ